MQSKVPLLTMTNVSVESVHTWTFSGINFQINTSNLTGLTLIVKTQPSLMETCKMEIKNSSFGSLDLRSCKATISNCYINAQSKLRNSLISAQNSFLLLRDCEFHRFRSKHAPTIVHGRNNTQVYIERTWIHQNRAVFGAIFLHDNCSIYVTETMVKNSRAFEDGFPTFVLWRNVQANITRSEFHNNVGHFGGTFWVSNNSSLTSNNTVFQENHALQGGVFVIHNNSKLTVVNTTFMKNQANANDLSLMKNVQSHLNVQPVLQNLLQKAKYDFRARKDYTAGGVVAASGSEVVLISSTFLRNTADDFGGALAVDTKLTIVDCAFSGNLATKGGAISPQGRSTDVCASTAVEKCNSDLPGRDNTSFYIRESTFEQNTAYLNGGAIAGSGCMIIDIQNSNFHLNQASEGGAIHLEKFVTINVRLCSFTDNVAHFQAGAIKLSTDITSHFSKCSFFRNSASVAGAVAIADGTSMNMENTLFEGNHGSELAGALFGHSNVVVRMKNTAFQSNVVESGSIMSLLRNSILEIYNSNFTKNTIHTGSGALLLADNIISSLNDCIFSENKGFIGSAIFAESNVELQIMECSFIENSAPLEGGAIFIENEITAVIDSSIFNGNTARQGGAVLMSNRCSYVIMNCTFNNNTALIKGGALLFYYYVRGKLSDSRFTNNNANSEWGVVVIENNSYSNISFCLFENNSAPAAGVMLAVEISILHIINCTFINNRAERSVGGAILVYNKTEAFIDNSTFINNTAEEGGAVFGSYAVTLTLQDSLFKYNRATETGGALTFYDGTRCDFFDCDFANNTATTGGAVYTAENGTIFINSSVFTNNTATDGAVIFMELNSSLNVNTSRFIGNKASGSGGVIVIQENATGTFLDSYFNNNTADQEGGVMFTSSNTFCQLTTCHLKYNSANYGGAIFAQVKVELLINKSNFEENNAEFSGAISANFKVNLSISETLFIRNSAVEVGGSILCWNISDAVITDTEFRQNTANKGGAVGFFDKTNVQIRSSHFISNAGLSKVDVAKDDVVTFYDDENVDAHLTLVYSTDGGFSEGGAISLNGNVTCSIFSSNFVNNTAYRGAGVSASDSVRLHIIKSYFQGNQAKYCGGSISVWFRSYMEAVESSFTTNTAVDGGGAVELSDDSSFNFISSSFTNNTAYREGGALQFTEAVGNVSLCSFTSNSPGVVHMSFNVTLQVQHSCFHQNEAIKCVGCLDDSATEGGCLLGFHLVYVSVINSSFTENIAQRGSVIHMTDQSAINISGSTFTSNKASEGGVISLSGQVNATISHCNFFTNTRLESGMTDITYSYFKGNNDVLLGGVVLSEDEVVVEIHNSIFCGNTAGKGGVLYIQKSKLTVLYSNFTGNAAEDVGGAIALFHDTQASILHSLFVGNKAMEGGAIFASRDCMLNLEHSNLTQNQARQTGGALVFVDGKYHHTPNEPTLTIVNSNFVMNTAKSSGAVYLSNRIKTTILNSTFSNNSAHQTAAMTIRGSTVSYIQNAIFVGNTEKGYGLPNILLYLPPPFGIMDEVSNVYGFDYKTGGVLKVIHESRLVCKNCSFLQNEAIRAGVGLLADNVQVVFDGSSFIENCGQYVGVFEAVDSVEVDILNSYFIGNAGTVADIGLLKEKSNINVSNITLDGTTNTANAFSLDSRRKNSVVVSDSKFKKTTLDSYYHCLFQCSKSSALMFYNVKLENKEFHCVSLISQESLLTINNSIITGNTFRNSFVTVSGNSTLKLHNSIIEANSIADTEHEDKYKHSLFTIRKNSSVEGDHCEINGYIWLYMG